MKKTTMRLVSSARLDCCGDEFQMDISKMKRRKIPNNAEGVRLPVEEVDSELVSFMEANGYQYHSHVDRAQTMYWYVKMLSDCELLLGVVQSFPYTSGRDVMYLGKIGR